MKKSLITTLTVTLAISSVIPAMAAQQKTNQKMQVVGDNIFKINSTTDAKNWSSLVHIPSAPAGVTELNVTVSDWATFPFKKYPHSIFVVKGGFVTIHVYKPYYYLRITNIFSASKIANLMNKSISQQKNSFVYPYVLTKSINKKIENDIQRYDTPSAGYVYFMDAKARNNETVFDFKYRETLSQSKQVKMDISKILKHILTPSMDEYQKEFEINNWIASHVRYDYSPGAVNDTDYTALTNGKAECTGIAELTYRMMTAAGIPTKFVTGTVHQATYMFRGKLVDMAGPKAPHIWNEVNLNGKWYMLDVTGELPGFYPNKKMGYNMFNLTSSQLAHTHTWNHAGLPVANTNFVTMLKHSKNPQDKQILRAIEG